MLLLHTLDCAGLGLSFRPPITNFSMNKAESLLLPINIKYLYNLQVQGKSLHCNPPPPQKRARVWNHAVFDASTHTPVETHRLGRIGHSL